VHSFTVDGKEGAYVTDPLRLINVVTRSTPHLCVGGDKGSDFTKLGITFMGKKSKSRFQAIVVFNGDDNYSTLSKLCQVGLLTFTGDSAAHTNIFSILQMLLDNGGFLNGDWWLLSSILGLIGPHL
jgi:hypothetical protein